MHVHPFDAGIKILGWNALLVMIAINYIYFAVE